MQLVNVVVKSYGLYFLWTMLGNSMRIRISLNVASKGELAQTVKELARVGGKERKKERKIE